MYKKPFEPKKEERPFTEISSFTLNTELRAKERELFEEEQKEREQNILRIKETMEQRRLAKEKEEYLRNRKAAEVKAHPIKKYKPVVIKPSGKVTEPVSPNFQSKKKHDNSDANKENSN